MEFKVGDLVYHTYSNQVGRVKDVSAIGMFIKYVNYGFAFEYQIEFVNVSNNKLIRILYGI